MDFIGGNTVTAPQGVATVADLRASAAALAGWAGQRVLLASDEPREQVIAVLGAAEIGFEVAIVPASWLTPQWMDTIRDRFHRVCSGLRPEQELPGGAICPVQEPGMVIFTSGSTGAPAPVFHSFAALDTFGHISHLRPHRWLVAYRTGSYAWTQVVMLGLLVPGQDLAFAASSKPDDLLAALGERVTAVSSTPSLWRYLLTCLPQRDLEGLGLQQITLGGEAVDQALLDRLSDAFKDARITQIYASTECGAVLSCSDGRAGFPLVRSERASGVGVPAVEVRGGTLHVRSPFGVAGSDTWFDTRDVAEVVGDRLHIRGRAERNAINVGGQLVALDELEAFVHEIRTVTWARAYPVPSAIVGSLVGLDVVLDAACDQPHDAVERHIRAACRTGLGKQYEPRIVRFVTEMTMTPSLKRATR